MKYNPHEYQKQAEAFIIDHPACALILDMGLGKTVITLSSLWSLIYDYFEISKVLVIAPLRVAQNTWPGECEKWDHLKELRISKVLGTANQRKKALEVEADIYIINRENVKWLCDSVDFDFDMVVIDELSSFKAHESKRFKALRKVRPKIKRIVGLTGTPAPNSLMDLWSEMNLIDMGERLGKYLTGYKNTYFYTMGKYDDRRNEYHLIPGYDKKIYSKISDICLTLKAEDYLRMPKRMDNEVKVKMSESEREQYATLQKEMFLSLGTGKIDAVNAVALSSKLLQIANGAVYDENHKVQLIHDRKLEALEDLIEGANGKPVLVLYGFRHDLGRIMERFGGVGDVGGVGGVGGKQTLRGKFGGEQRIGGEHGNNGVRVLRGTLGTSSQAVEENESEGQVLRGDEGRGFEENRDEGVEQMLRGEKGEKFGEEQVLRGKLGTSTRIQQLLTSEDIESWNRGEISVAVAHPASIGHGLNLQAGGSIIIWFSLTWSLELYLQANARLWRQGQKETVIVHHIITEGTVDEFVMKALKRKDKGQKALIKGLEALREKVSGGEEVGMQK